MTTKIIKALDESIKHWEDNVSVFKRLGRSEWDKAVYNTYYARRTLLKTVRVGIFAEDCSLCHLFRFEDCEGCPLRAPRAPSSGACCKEWRNVYKLQYKRDVAYGEMLQALKSMLARLKCELEKQSGSARASD